MNKLLMNKLTSLFIFIFSITCAVVNAADLKDYFVPVPRQVEQLSGSFDRKEGRIIIPEGSLSLFEMARSVKSLLSQIKMEATIAAKAARGENPLVWIFLSPSLSPQAYKITIQPNQILLEGGDEAGLFYAVQTFKQIIQYAQDTGTLPLVSIEDAPDFKRRGVSIDISRNKVPAIKTLKNLVDLLSSWKINEFQLYTENTFAYQNHREVWEGFSPLTAEEILDLDQYCRERYIDLIPNQASFAHMNQWFEHDRYKGLAEVLGPSSHINLSPAVPGTMELLSELYTELLPNFSSRYFNINCDETDYLGKGRTKEWVEKKGKGEVYYDFILQLKNEVEKQGRTVRFWADVISQHPELISKLPKNMIALVWSDYNACKTFQEAGVPFFICPMIASVLSVVGHGDVSLGQMRGGAEYGKKYGAMGFQMNDWGNDGHWQPLSVSYPAYIYGAAVSWGYAGNQQIDVGSLLSRYIFIDSTGKTGQALSDIGNAFTKTGINIDAFVFDKLLKRPNMDLPKGASKEGFLAAIEHLDNNLKTLVNTPTFGDEATLIKTEMTLAVSMAKLSCEIGLDRLNTPTQKLEDISSAKRDELIKKYQRLIEEFKNIWLLRNRPGGLHKSAGHLEKALTILKN